MRTELISIATPTTPLDGAFHTPEPGPPSMAVQLFHGNTMNFYVGPPRFLPGPLAAMNLASLAYNRRGHDVMSNRSSRAVEGGAFQTIAEALEDDRLARGWLASGGFPDPVLIGHSNGGLLAATNAASHGAPALVMLSAHRGGRDIMAHMAANGLMAQEGFAETSAEARSLVAAGRGDTLLVTPGWWYVITARTYVEFLDNCPDLIEQAAAVTCPVLFIRGDAEPPDTYPAEAFAEACPGPVDIEIIPSCDHYYAGREDAVIDVVTAWLGDVLTARTSESDGAE